MGMGVQYLTINEGAMAVEQQLPRVSAAAFHAAFTQELAAAAKLELLFCGNYHAE